MPESALKYTLELREAREYHFRDGGRGNKEATRQMLEKEREYVELSKDLACKEVVLLDLERIISSTENTIAGRELRDQACYVAFLSKNNQIISKLLKTSHADWDISQLEEADQKQLLNQLTENGIINKAKMIIENNGYIEYLPAVFTKMNEIDNPKKRYRYLGLLARYFKPEWRTMMINAFDSEENEHEKSYLAYELLPAPLDEVWVYYQQRMNAGNDKAGGEQLARYGCPADLIYFKKGAELLWNDSDALEAMGDQLKYLGYAGDFSWYWHMLSHPNARVRRSFHWLMLSFFPEEDDTLAEGWELTGWPEEEPEATTEALRDFWKKKSDYVKVCLRPDIRYWHGKPFDIVEVFKEVYDDNDTNHWRTYADMLEMWTGRHFPLDPYALYEKQFRQYDAILAWLEAHRHEYQVGAWYRWGKQLPIVLQDQ